jgi:MSHA biogenesis protein MshL
MSHQPFKFLLAPIAAILLMTGCANTRPTLSEDPDQLKSAVTTITDKTTESRIDIDADFDLTDMFVVRPLNEKSSNDPRLQAPVKGFSLTESSVYDAMQLLADTAGLALSIEGGSRALERHGAIAIFNTSGTVASILERASRRLGFFWRVDGDDLIIDQEDQFVVKLPPVLTDDSLSGIANTLTHLGAKDAYLNRADRTLVFQTNRKSLPKIEKYLNGVRESRSMIIYGIEIWEVVLTDSTSRGINWNKLGWTYGSAAAGGALGLANVVPTKVAGMGATMLKGRFELDSVLQFLETQGTVRTLSQPRLSLMNGSKGTLKVGQQTTYISKVGTNATAALAQTTVETANLSTGLQLALTADYHDKTVLTKIHLNLTDLQKFTKFTALGTDLNLPQVTNRDIDTDVRTRPGDTILLAGFRFSNETSDNTSDIVGVGRNNNATRNELVIGLTTKVIRFNGKEAK